MRISHHSRPVVAGLVASVLVAASAATALASRTGPVRNASGPGWRIVTTIGPRHGGANTSLAGIAAGRSDAWLVGRGCLPNCDRASNGPALVEHWTGGRWHRIALPGGYKFAGVAAVGESPQSDTWIAAQIGRVPTSTIMLHWTGSGFRTWNLGRLDTFGVLPTGSRQAWAFAFTFRRRSQSAGGQALRYDGHSWRRYLLPAVPAAATVTSIGDIWAVGPTQIPMWIGAHPHSFRVVHWNGRQWQSLAVPSVTPPRGYYRSLNGIVELGPHDVLVDGSFDKVDWPARGRFLARWDGHRWSRITVPLQATDLGQMVSDGAGGTWIAAKCQVRAAARRTFGDCTLHYHPGRGGTAYWTSASLPRGHDYALVQLAHMPGSRSLWAIGQQDFTARDFTLTTWGVVTRYVP